MSREHESRQALDALLERFQLGDLDEPTLGVLKSRLYQIRDYKAGQEADFPVYPGDQMAAAVILRVIESRGLFGDQAVR